MLLLGGVEAGIGDRVGVPRPQSCNCLELWRIDRVSGHVVDRRQSVGRDTEVERISNEREPDEKCSDRLAHSPDALSPDDRAGAKREQNCDDR